MQQSEEAGIMTLRDHLLQNAQSVPPAPPSSLPPPHDGMHAASPHDHHIDPAIAGSGYSMPLSAESGTEEQSHEVRKGRRELSTSKRAAQNRAAQRAFRQRKEAYISSLQEKVKEYEQLIGNYKAIQQENFHLREYIIQLQGRLLERHDDVPPPPASIDLTNPPQRPQPPEPAPIAPMDPSAVDELRMAARAAEHAASITGSGAQDTSRAVWPWTESGVAYHEQNPPGLPAHDTNVEASGDMNELDRPFDSWDPHGLHAPLHDHGSFFRQVRTTDTPSSLDFDGLSLLSPDKNSSFRGWSSPSPDSGGGSAQFGPSIPDQQSYL